MRPWSLLLVLGVAGCGGLSGPSQPVDETLRRDARAGRVAYDLEQSDQAIREYHAALLRAEERDDASAIAITGYDLAVAQLRANRPQAALGTVQSIRAALARRGQIGFAELGLLEATALYRSGERDAADRGAAQLVNGGNAGVAARAAFLRGLIADERGDFAGLLAMRQAIGSPVDADLRADALELNARILWRQAAWQPARAAASEAADLRREMLDYRGMARALSLAADAAERAGDRASAADLYLRAGRSAAEQGDRVEARGWIQRALVLSTDPQLRNAARGALARISGRKA